MEKQQVKEILDIIQAKLDKKQAPLIVGEDVGRCAVWVLQERLKDEYGDPLKLLIINSSRTTDYLDMIRWWVYDKLPDGREL